MSQWYQICGEQPKKQVQLVQHARVTVGAVILISSFFLSPEGTASTSSSWSDQPSWATSPSDSSMPPAPHRSSSRAKDLASNNDPSPFAPGSNNIALDLGQVFLMGDVSKYADSLGTQLHYTYGVSDLLDFDSSFGYSQHSNGQLTLYSLLTGVRLNLSWYDKIIPYVVGGLGFYMPSYQDNTAPSSATSSNVTAVLFGLHVGPGVDLELSRNMFFGASITFNNMFGEQGTWANGSHFNIGGSYVSFFMHIGATF